MGEADRIARDRARRQVADRLQAKRHDEEQRGERRLRLLSDVRSLVKQALPILLRDPEHMNEIHSFKVSRSLRNPTGSRGGWLLGNVLGGLGHGETGPIELYLLTSGEFVFGGRPSLASAVETDDLHWFSDSQLEAIVKLLQDVVTTRTA